MIRAQAAGIVLAASVLSIVPTRGAAPPSDPAKVVEDAKAKANAIPAQAEALARLAWPDDGGDPAVRKIAREQLVDFADAATDALWKAVIHVKPEYKAEVVQTLLAGFRRLTEGLPANYLPALDDAVWFGTREARILAIPELGRFRNRASVLPIIDAAIEDPQILEVAVKALGAIGDERARFFLAKVLDEGGAEIRDAAAVALGRLGDEGRAMLKSAMRSPRRELRLSAVRALLPVATVEDLTALHEFATSHAADDAATAKSVEAAAATLEKVLEAREAADSATPGPR